MHAPGDTVSGVGSEGSGVAKAMGPLDGERAQRVSSWVAPKEDGELGVLVHGPNSSSQRQRQADL